MIVDGKPGGNLEHITYVFFKNTKITQIFSEDIQKTVFLDHWCVILNPAIEPKRISIYEHKIYEQRVTNSIPEWVLYSGIYKFDDDYLTIAYRKGDAPPEKYESKPGSAVTLLVLKRLEPTRPGRGGGLAPGMPQGGFGGEATAAQLDQETRCN